ncbi:MAG: hypothetical protein CMK07_12670 [Ponticaulis sp.]|nr:hypothetical protein [Ponticaulis sp.]
MIPYGVPVGPSNRQFRSRMRLFYRAVGLSVLLGVVCGVGGGLLIFLVELLFKLGGDLVIWGALGLALLTSALSFLYMTFTRKGWLLAARNRELADQGVEIALRTGVEIGFRSMEVASKTVKSIGDAASNVDIDLSSLG